MKRKTQPNTNMRLYLSCKSNGIECTYGPMSGSGKQVIETVRTVTELKKFIRGKRIDVILCSSSMDFPKEYTKDKKVIALCNWIRKD